MVQCIAYRPRINQEQLRAFDQYMARCPGNWTVTHSFVHAGDPRILRLHWIVPGSLWGDIPGFLTFLDLHQHRMLLRCFLTMGKQHWSVKELSQKVPDFSRNDIDAFLSFCEVQELLVVRKALWEPGPHMISVQNLGATFEWVVQENLQRFHNAVARRCVALKEIAHLGDLDVLAFLHSGLVMIVECKSSTSGISNGHITRFLQRARLFPAHVALLLIDTPHAHHITERLVQIRACLDNTRAEPLGCYTTESGGLIYHIQKNIYIANTAGGIQGTLHTVLQVAILDLQNQTTC